jgi:hypothetical protein
MYFYFPEERLYNPLRNKKFHEVLAETPCVDWEKSWYGKVRILHYPGAMSPYKYDCGKLWNHPQAAHLRKLRGVIMRLPRGNHNAIALTPAFSSATRVRGGRRGLPPHDRYSNYSHLWRLNRFIRGRWERPTVSQVFQALLVVTPSELPRAVPFSSKLIYVIIGHGTRGGMAIQRRISHDLR